MSGHINDIIEGLMKSYKKGDISEKAFLEKIKDFYFEDIGYAKVDHHRLLRRDFPEVINQSINETLSRTALTSVTTLIVVAALFVLGGGVIHDFAFALLVGIIVGTYSSVFVASPILLLWGGDPGKGGMVSLKERGKGS